MHRGARAKRGVTLVELLLAVVFLGLCAAPIMGCIILTRRNVAEAKVQAQVMNLIRTDITSTLVGNKLARLVTGITTSTTTLPGGCSVTLSRSITSVVGYKNLFSVKTTATWKALHAGDRADTASLETYAYSAPLL